MTLVVVDASELISFLLPDEDSERADTLVRDALTGAVRLCSSRHLWPEVVEALNRARRRGRLDEGQWRAALSLAARLDIEMRGEGGTPLALAELAETEGLSAYDAAYLALATALSAPLATADRRLAAAARRRGLLYG